MIDRYTLMKIKEFFMNTTQTNWGKNQVIIKIIEIENACIAAEKKETRVNRK